MTNDAEKINATYRLATMRKLHPELNRALADATLELAAAIIRLDDAERRAEESTEPLHTFQEQSAVLVARDAHAQALANLLRGETIEP